MQFTHGPTAFVRGTGNTSFGRLSGSTPLTLMARAADAALADAELSRSEIDGVLCGYATTMPHLMLADRFCEFASLTPAYAHGMAAGGATGGAMAMLARELVRAGRCRHVLVVAGENRLSGQSRDQSVQTLAQVGEPQIEVPNGASVPAYYALLASRYLMETGLPRDALADFAVLMREHAASHPDAHLRESMSRAATRAAKPVAAPLLLSDCCPISDGAVAVVVSAQPGRGRPVRIAGAGQAHRHQHLCAIDSVMHTGAADAAQRALGEAGFGVEQIDYLAIYDSFTITLLMLLEEIGIAPRGGAHGRLLAGDFGANGQLPLNTHGGLLAFGHSGVAGGLMHLAEAARQLAGRAGPRQISPRRRALFHADGGVLSSHVSLVLEAAS
ncbi:thiolase family protein [Cupriavidus sp. AU9028]|uniref:thiolase family protein n=1 Tax=Cupriavidus sp. AU9028 TaxID=2871157 RepID=UPI001C96F3FB|nr:thiolase family protein [Cupriavidus sp. AU9028]MBY4897022.1 thiolase family protein [Cupriavidus sp. AU9028]